MFAPLRAANVHAGMNVGIVGVGGLGHYGIIFAKAMGADKVVGISRKESKRDEVLSFRADDYIATDEEKDWVEKHRGTLDLIVCTVASSKVSFYVGPCNHIHFTNRHVLGTHQRLPQVAEDAWHVCPSGAP